MVYSNREEVIVRDAISCADELRGSIHESVTVGRRKEVEYRLAACVNGNRSCTGNVTGSRCNRRHDRNRGYAFELAKALVAAKEKRFVFDYRSAQREPKLVAAKLRLVYVKEIPGVQIVV